MKEEAYAYISEKYQKVLDDFNLYIDFLYQNWEISEKDYFEIQESLKNETFKNLLATFSLSEILNIVWAKIKYSVIAVLSLHTPENTGYYIGGILISERILRVLYTFLIARSWNVDSPFYFWALSSIPFWIWKTLAVTYWLRGDVQTIKKFTEYQKEKIHWIVSQPLFQAIIKTLV